MQNIIKMNKVIVAGLFLASFLGVFFVTPVETVSADEKYELNCPYSAQAGRTIVNFSTPGNRVGIRSDQSLDRAQVQVNTNIAPGTYRIHMYTYDGYAERVDKNQPNEKLYLKLNGAGGLIATTGHTSDLPDNITLGTANSLVSSSLNITSTITSVTAFHSVYPDGSSPNSLSPSCATFDLITPPTPDLSVTCSVSPSSVNVGNSVNWSVNASGGTGSYTYSWSGDESLSGNSSSVSKSYSSAGTKLGIVTVTSGALSVTRTCSVAVTQQTSGLTGSCSASPSTVAVGGTINWSSSVSGGTGSYTYLWSGSDNLSGNNSSVSKSYSVAGAKNASVLVTSGSLSQTFYCNGNVTDTPPPSGDLNVSCDVDDSRVETDEDVRFTANATGGNGSYTYTWTGSEGLYSTNRSFEWSFDDDGTKRATVVVMSNGMTASDTCSVRVEDEDEDDEDLRVSCYANPSNVQVGQQMRWYADVRGGDGDYDYDWDGDDGLNSSSYSPSMTYNNPGTKDATVRVRSNGQTETADCSVNVNQNQVLAFSQSDVPLQGAVYLSEVPYTGLADNLKLFWFVLGLAMFSAYVAYVVIAYKNNAGELN